LDYEEFVKDRVIGEGSFGIVFVGKYRGNDVAIKQTKNFSWPEEVVEAFRREVQMMDKMRCPYIINFVGAVDTPGHYSIVTEYAKFGSLKNAYESSKFSNLLGVKMLTDVAKGMTFLHAAMIIHRDLKPDNVLIVSMSNKEKVNAKISDFGTSRDVSSSNVVSTMTQGIGTPMYMAPELLLNQEYGQAVDIFSYAVLCYEVMQRKIPYTDETFTHSWDISDFVTKGNRLQIPKTFPEEIQKIIAECWVADPASRPKFPEIEERMESLWKDMYQKHVAEKQLKKENSKKEESEEEEEVKPVQEFKLDLDEPKKTDETTSILEENLTPDEMQDILNKKYGIIALATKNGYILVYTLKTGLFRFSIKPT